MTYPQGSSAANYHPLDIGLGKLQTPLFHTRRRRSTCPLLRRLPSRSAWKDYDRVGTHFAQSIFYTLATEMEDKAGMHPWYTLPGLYRKPFWLLVQVSTEPLQ